MPISLPMPIWIVIDYYKSDSDLVIWIALGVLAGGTALYKLFDYMSRK